MAAIAHAPVGGEQAAFRHLRFAERRACQSGNDLVRADREQAAHQSEAILSELRVALGPVEDSGSERRGIKGIGNLIAVSCIGPGIFAPPSAADGLGEIAFEIAEEWERPA